jgi:anti-sigma-K factor RskA
MKCAEVYSNLAAFALGGLEPAETAEVRHHLASCSSCQRDLRELEEVNHALEAAPSPSADPPAYLKDEILARVRAEEPSISNKGETEEPFSVEDHSRSSRTSRFNRVKALRVILPSVAAAAVVAIIALGVFFGFLREEAPVATIQLVPTPQEAAGLEGYWGVAEIRPQPSGNQQVELKLNNFEEPKPNSYYELWFVSGEKRISAGSFISVGKGETRVLLNVAPEARNYHTLLITEKHADSATALSQEVALKGEMP